MINAEQASLTALVIDDNPRWRARLGEVLRAEGWTVLALSTAPDDLPLAAYRLVVLDAAGSAGQTQAREVLQRMASASTHCILAVRQAAGALDEALAAHPNVAAVIEKASFQDKQLGDLVRGLLPPRASRPPGPTAAPPAGPRVLVVEDDAHWRDIYQEILLDAGCAPDCAVSYGEARGWLQRVDYALAIVDLNLASSAAPDGNRDGLLLLRATRQRGVPSIVVSALGDPADIDRAYDEFGIFTFVEKEGFDRRSFRRLVAEAMTPPAAEIAEPAQAATGGLELLTPREREVLALLTEGCTNRQIAQALLITPNTTKKHVDHILQKLGVSTRAGAVAAALRGGE